MENSTIQGQFTIIAPTYNFTVTGVYGTAYGDEAAAKNYVENQARAGVNTSAVTITATKVSYTAPIAGDGDKLNGTNGSVTI